MSHIDGIRLHGRVFIRGIECESAFTNGKIREDSRDLISATGFDSLVTSFEPAAVRLILEIAKLA